MEGEGERKTRQSGEKGKREAGRKETDRQDRWMEKPVVTCFLA